MPWAVLGTALVHGRGRRQTLALEIRVDLVVAHDGRTKFLAERDGVGHVIGMPVRDGHHVHRLEAREIPGQAGLLSTHGSSSRSCPSG